MIKFKDMLKDDTIDDSIKLISKELKIRRGTTGLLVGFGGSGKTLIMCDVAIKLALQKSFFDCGFKEKPINTLFIDYETGKEDSKRNIRRLLNSQELNDNFTYHKMENPFIYKNEDNEEQNFLPELEEMIEEEHFDLVIIDNFTRMVNSNTTINDQKSSDILNLLRNISKKKQITIIVLHHEGKAGLTKVNGNKKGLTSGTGTQSLTDAVDWKLIMESDGNGGNKVYCAKANSLKPVTFYTKFIDEGEKIEKYAGEMSEYLIIKYSKEPFEKEIDIENSNDEKIKKEILSFINENEYNKEMKINRELIKQQKLGRNTTVIKNINLLIEEKEIFEIGKPKTFITKNNKLSNYLVEGEIL